MIPFMVGFAIVAALLIAPKPGHLPWRPGVDPVPGPERFEIDEGLPTPYHDRSGRARESVASAWEWWSDRYSLAVASLLAVLGYVVVAWVIVPAVRNSWWPVLRDFARELMGGGTEMAIDLKIECDGCPAVYSLDDFYDRDWDPVWDARATIERAGWSALWVSGRMRVSCPECRGRATQAGAVRGGFTLVELLVVLVIVSLLLVAAAAAFQWAWKGQRVTTAAQLLQAQAVEARERARLANGYSGFRIEADQAFPVKRLANGSIDPSEPLAFSRVVPLGAAPGYSTGAVAIHDSFPAGFVPPINRLVLEQEVAHDVKVSDGAGGLKVVRVLNDPTAWEGNARVGDRIKIGVRNYTICGPMFRGPTTGNPEGFVNYDPAWKMALNRGDGPAEFLYLVNGLDDDGDGYVDNGWNGLDDDLDGVVDSAGEWSERETWGTLPVARNDMPYTLFRRPVPAIGSTGFSLGGAVIDATTWSFRSSIRSRLPIDPWTGAVELIVDAEGRWSRTRWTATPGTDRFFHFWIANREDVAAPAYDPKTGDPILDADGDPTISAPQTGTETMARLVSIDARNGRSSAIEADPKDPKAALRAAELGGR